MKIIHGNDAVYPVIVPAKNHLESYNFFLYESKGTLTLIDAGMPNEESWEHLTETLDQYGFSLKDISQILLTHHHTDHVGVVNRISMQNPVPVYAHPSAIPRLKREPEFMEKRIAFYEALYKEAGNAEAGEKQIKYLQEAVHKNAGQAIQAEIFPLQSMNKRTGLETVALPGHSPDQVGFFHTQVKWLFGGDLLMNPIAASAIVDVELDGQRKKPLLQHIESLKKAKSLELALVFAGHGSLVEHPSSLIDQRLETIKSKANRFLAHIRQGATTADDVAKMNYQKRYETMFPLIMSETLVYLDYLEAKKRIEKTSVQGVWHYKSSKASK